MPEEFTYPEPETRAEPLSSGLPPAQAPRIIRRYGTRRLYDARLSRCVTMEEIGSFLRAGDDVRVVDERDQDITRRVLLQLILDDPNRSGIDLLPIPLLRTMLSVRSEAMVRWLEQYLSAGAEWLDRQSGPFRFPTSDLGQAMKAFMPWVEPPMTHAHQSPPGPAAPPPAPDRSGERAHERPARGAAAREEQAALRDQVDELQRRLAELSARMKRR